MRLVPPARVALAAAVAAWALAPAGPEASGRAHVVGDDRGGSVRVRAAEISRFDAEGVEIRIEGRICHSACTLYLGAAHVCVSPTTQFGFHGPSDHGVRLPAARFERWSHLMAGFYREPIRSWFLSDARYLIRAARYRSGADLIALGWRAC